MKTIKWADLSPSERIRYLQRSGQASADKKESFIAAVQTIIEHVRQQGDYAVKDFTKQYDGVALETLRVSHLEQEHAATWISAEAKQAIQHAATNIEQFHLAQRQEALCIETMPGIVCERQYRPIQRVGLYVPGGTAPLVSSVLMQAIPAKIAQCPMRILATPPNQNGEIDPHILYAAAYCGIENIYKMGGAQAIAAMAFGTETIPKVDKIFGPGNRWVTQAKMRVAEMPGGAAYDLPAGPSEVMVIVDNDANPAWVAADLLSQAEHDPGSQVILVSTSQHVIDDVLLELPKQCQQLTRQAIAEQALQKSCAILVENLSVAMDVANQYAPEHLILQCTKPEAYKSAIVNAGSVFVGPWSPEAVGDYASGTNHVLPTYGYAHAYSGLSLQAFMKHITFQTLTQSGLQAIADSTMKLAALEGLDAHANAVKVRLGDV